MSPYLPKAPTVSQEDSWIKLGLSLALFLASFYWLLDQDIYLTLVLALALFVHELGHLLMMKHFKYVDVRIFFLPFLGVVAEGKSQKISQKQRTMILIAGPLPGILLGVVAYVIGESLLNQYLQLSGIIFIFLNVFKLLPLVPLDGGDLINTLFFAQKNRVEIIFILISIIVFLLGAYFSSYYRLLLVPGFLLIRLYQSIKMLRIRQSLDQKK